MHNSWQWMNSPSSLIIWSRLLLILLFSTCDSIILCLRKMLRNMARSGGNQSGKFLIEQVTKNDVPWSGQNSIGILQLRFLRDPLICLVLWSRNVGCPPTHDQICYLSPTHLSHNFSALVLGTSNVDKTEHTIPSFRKDMINKKFFSSCLPAHPISSIFLSIVCLSCFWIYQSLPPFDL